MPASSLLSALLQRLLMALLTLWLLSLIIFFTLSLVAGDAAVSRLGGLAGMDQINALRHQLGLDLPVWTRYFAWLTAALQGNFGVSYINGESVAHLLVERGKNSLLTGGITVILLVMFSLLAGIFSGLRQGSRLDRLISALALVLQGIPPFVTGTILVLVFAFALHWAAALSIPLDSMTFADWCRILILPILTLLSISLAQNIRMIRAGVISVSGGEACHMARLNGFSEWQVVLFWILPVAVINYLPLLARYISGLLSGALIVETLFAWPGLASALLSATQSRDIPVVMAISMLLCLLTVIINALADMASLLLNPAARRQ